MTYYTLNANTIKFPIAPFFPHGLSQMYIKKYQL